jgi:tetratricopeptide (TPR) repeat protein
VGALTLSTVPSPSAPALLALRGAVRDGRASVRIAAAFSLMSLGVRELPGDDGPRYKAAKDEYVRRAALLGDDAPTQLELGKFLFLDRDYPRAGSAFEDALRLRVDQPGAQYFLALARLGEGRPAEARNALARVPAGDPYAGAVRELLGKVPER